MTLVWCFLLGSAFVQTFPLSITGSLRRGCYYSSIKMQSLPAHLVRKGRARSQVSCSSTPRGPTTFADVTGLVCPPANSLWHIPYATFPEAIGGLPAAEICVGRCLDGYHSMCGPHSISFTRSLLAMQVPGICALTRLPFVSDPHYNSRTTTLENLDWHFSNHVP